MAKRQLDKHIAQLTYTQIQKFLPDPDKVLQKAGKGLEAYRDLLIDGHLTSVKRQKELMLESMEWELYKEETPEPIYEFVNQCLKDINIHQLIKDILFAQFMGTAVIEIIWKLKNGYWVPEELQSKPIEWFRLKTDRTWRMFLPKSNGIALADDGEELPEYKFLIVQNSPNEHEPYGDKLLKKCFWPVLFRRGDWKFWSKFTEKYGMPTTIGKLPAGSPEEKVNKMLDALEQLFEDAVAVVPSDGSVERLAESNTSSAESYKMFLESLNDEISKIVLTQTLTTEIGSAGSYAASNTHMDILKASAQSDANFISEAMKTLIRYIVELNFSNGSDSLPKFTMYFPYEVDKNLVDRDKVLNDMGVKFNKNYFARAYNLQEDEFDLPEPATKQEAAFASPIIREDTGITDPIEALTNAIVQKAVASINTFSSFAELQQNLDKVFSAMDASKIREALAKESFAAQIKGTEDVG